MTRTESLPTVNGLALKLIALVTMTIDHTAAVLNCGRLYLPMRCIGRIAFPIYCFLLVEGYFHTKHMAEYMERLLTVGIVSELPFDLMAAHSFPSAFHQNVMFTLLLGLAAVWLMDHRHEWIKAHTGDGVMMQLLDVFTGLAILFAGDMAGNLLKVDYHGGGVMLILAFYAFRGKRLPTAALVAFVLYHFYSTMELFGLIALVPICLYNGRRGPMPGGKVGQLFFYWYYPLHIGVLVVLAAVLGVHSYVFFA